MEKEFKGSLDFTIREKNGEYYLEWSRNRENELAAAMIAREMTGFNKQFLEKLIKNLKGEDLKRARARLSRMSVANSALTTISQEIIHHLLNEKTEPTEPIIPPIDGDKEPGSLEKSEEKDQVEAGA